MKKLIVLISAGVLGCTSNLLAQTQIEMNMESHETYKKVDKELNVVYGEVMNSMKASQKALLKTAQKAWITYRDADCKCAGNGYEGGSIQPLVINECLTDRTKTRIKELKEMLEY